VSFSALVSRIPRNITGLVSGVVSSRINDRIRGLTARIPTGYLGIANALLQDSTVDPMQNLMFRVVIQGHEFPDHLIQAVSLPQYTIKYRTQRQGGLPVHYPNGIDITSDLVIKFNETRRSEVLQFYNGLMEKVFTTTALEISTDAAGAATGQQIGGTYGNPADYKLEITVDFLGQGDTTPTFSISYAACSPCGITGYEMDAAGGSFVQPSIAFKPEAISMYGGQNRSGGPLSDIVGNVTRSVGGNIRNYIGF
jgi:hypothetical protein